MNDEILTFYYYADGLSVDQRREVESALANDPQLAARYEQLCLELDALAEIEDQPAPAHLLVRWQDAIDRVAAREAAVDSAPASGFRFGSPFWGGVVAASLAIGIAIGVYLGGTGPAGVESPNTVAHSDQPIASPAVFTRGLLVHFQDSHKQLIALSSASTGNRSQLIMNIVQQNRLFEIAAERSDVPDLARVLRAFEPLLLRLAVEELPEEEIAALQSQLGFELNIMLTKLSREQSDRSGSFET